MAGAFPRYAAFKSKYSGKYLRYIDENVQTHGYVQYSGDNVVSVFTKYELEPAKTGQGLVNIRSCYNNKYWMCASETSNWVFAGANEPQEDKSIWSCTLFEPIYVSSREAYRFRHVKLGYNATLSRTASGGLKNCLFMGSSSSENDQSDLHEIVSWESLVALPKYVSFKGDNGKYLSGYWYNNKYRYLQFSSDDIGNPKVGTEIFTMSDGSIRIKSSYAGTFWRRDPDWIKADSTDTTGNNKQTLFWPVRVSENVVALRNLANNSYCRRLSTDGKNNCLNASVATITKEARLEVEESVLSRDIYNVVFRLLDSRIYNQTIVTMANSDASNNNTESSIMELKFKYLDESSKTWDSSLTLNLKIETKLTAGIPFIGEGTIETTSNFESEYKWGETIHESKEIETTYTVNVPPMTMMRVSLLATKGVCDVPFSYTQRDTLVTGEQVITKRDDGIYTGVNCYNFIYENKATPL